MVGHCGGCADGKKGICTVIYRNNIGDALHDRAALLHLFPQSSILARQAQFLCLLPELMCLRLNILCGKNTADDGKAAHLPALQLPDIVSSDSADRDNRDRNTLTDFLKKGMVHGLCVFFG